MALSDSRPTRRLCDGGAASPRRDGSPPLTRITLPACRAPYPGGSRRGLCRLLPRSHGLPRFPGGSASASSLSRPPQASRALRPAGLLNRPRRPSSRGSGPVRCPTQPLVSYQINRQLSGWNLPPLVIRAVGAHWEVRVLEVPDPVRHAEVAQINDGDDLARLQLGEGQIGEVPIAPALAEKGLVERGAVAQEADAELLDEIEVPLPETIVAALLHLVPAHTAVFDGGVTVLNAGREQEQRRPGHVAIGGGSPHGFA